MTYRNLSVEGKEYKFTVGKKFTKVIPENGPSLIVENSKIGVLMGKIIFKDWGYDPEIGDECQIDVMDSDNLNYAVKPSHIRQFIIEKNNEKR